MKELVEGTWKNYKFELCPPTDMAVIDEVCQHMRENYMKDGVLYKYLEWTENTGHHSDIIVQRIIAQGLSFLVRDTENGEVGQGQVSMIQYDEMTNKRCLLDCGSPAHFRQQARICVRLDP